MISDTTTSMFTSCHCTFFASQQIPCIGNMPVSHQYRNCQRDPETLSALSSEYRIAA